ncbi:MAG: hypothetical protein WDA23_04980, partial [Gemmobacter sp.]
MPSDIRDGGRFRGCFRNGFGPGNHRRFGGGFRGGFGHPGDHRIGGNRGSHGNSHRRDRHGTG